jgi:xanthine dehydrogenase accessory factor
MAVSREGEMTGSVSGGCVETTVYQEMMAVLRGGEPRLLHFGITEDMTWDVGLACGGTIDVFVQRLDAGTVMAVADNLEAGRAFVLATVLEGDAAGESVVVTRDQLVSGEVPGDVVQEAQAMIARHAETGAIYQAESGAQAFLQPFPPPPVMIIVGGVHAAIPLTRFAKTLGFEVTVIDPRAKFANRERFPHADRVLVEWPDEALADLRVDEATYLVLLTHDPKIDEPTLAAALKTEAAYIGAIGSRKTHAERFDRMAKWGVSAQDLARVYAPVGLDLGGRSPEEMALSIMAEVIAVKNGRAGSSLSQTTGPIGR